MVIKRIPIKEEDINFDLLYLDNLFKEYDLSQFRADMEPLEIEMCPSDNKLVRPALVYAVDKYSGMIVGVAVVYNENLELANR